MNRQKYIRGLVLGQTCKIHLDNYIANPSLILQGAGQNVQNLASIFDPPVPYEGLCF